MNTLPLLAQGLALRKALIYGKDWRSHTGLLAALCFPPSMLRAIRKHEEDICKLFLNVVAVDMPSITVHGVTDLEQVQRTHPVKDCVSGGCSDAYFLPHHGRREWTSTCSTAGGQVIEHIIQTTTWHVSELETGELLVVPDTSTPSTFPNRHGLRRESLSGSILESFISLFSFLRSSGSLLFILCARLSFCHYHTMEEVSTVLKALKDIVVQNH